VRDCGDAAGNGNFAGMVNSNSDVGRFDGGVGSQAARGDAHVSRATKGASLTPSPTKASRIAGGFKVLSMGGFIPG